MGKQRKTFGVKNNIWCIGVKNYMEKEVFFSIAMIKS